MRIPQFFVRNLTSALVPLVACILLSTGGDCSAQEPQPSAARWFELLTMNGGKPSLSATGEGISSYKITELYQRGTMRAKLVQATALPFKIELPIGYSVFNNLIYLIETDAVFTGPTDITFNLPSARTKETFAQLRILYADSDYANPKVPKWIDATVTDDNLARESNSLTQSEFKQRLRDFDKRTLHAFTEYDEPVVLIVALVDTAKVRDKFTADLQLTGTATPVVTEGRTVTYELKITNKGPDTANAISLHATPGFSFVSVNSSQEKCTMQGQNVYCKFASLGRDQTIDVKIIERCDWGDKFPNAPPGYETPTSHVLKNITVGATEQDPSYENNELNLTTEVYPDSNKGPIIEVLSPTLFQQFPGPAAQVPIRFKASDPDGFIKKVELFAHGVFTELKSIGEPTLRSDGEYELIYQDVPFGRQWVMIVATDNLGRVETIKLPEFFVNGTARVEIINPKAGSKLNLADGEFAVTIHATNPSPLKKVSLDVWGSDATAIGNDDYVVKLKYCFHKCRLQAVAIDENGVETRSDYLEFTMMEPPKARLTWFDGEYAHNFEDGKTFKVNELLLVASAGHEQMGNDAEINKIEIFANGALVCTDDSPTPFGFSGECVWKPSPGKYRLQVVATDSDGAVGKSEVFEVTIERP